MAALAAIAGRPVVTLSIAYAGASTDAGRDLAPFAALGPPAAGDRRTDPYLESQHAFDDANAWGHRVYTKSGS